MENEEVERSLTHEEFLEHVKTYSHRGYCEDYPSYDVICPHCGNKSTNGYYGKDPCVFTCKKCRKQYELLNQIAIKKI